MNTDDRYRVALGEIMSILARQDAETRARMFSAIAAMEQVDPAVLDALANFDTVFSEHFA